MTVISSKKFLSGNKYRLEDNVPFRNGTRISVYVWSNWGPNYFWGVPKSFVIHLIHGNFRIHSRTRSSFHLLCNLYKSSICHRLNPKFAAIETLLAFCLNNDHVVHRFNRSIAIIDIIQVSRHFMNEHEIYVSLSLG